jgi:hypothetical protein
MTGPKESTTTISPENLVPHPGPRDDPALTQLAVAVNIEKRPNVSDLFESLEEIGDELGFDRFKGGRTGVSFGAWVASHHVRRPLVALSSGRG